MSVKFVRDLMHIGVTTCSVETPLTEAMHILLRDGLESLIVLDDNGHAAGLFGRREAMATYGLSGLKSRDPKTLTVADAMRLDIPEIPPDIPAPAAIQMMLDQDIRAIYLMHHDGGIMWPSAVLRFEDVLRYLTKQT